MVWKMKCDCNVRNGCEIDSIQFFNEVKTFFSDRLNQKVFQEEDIKEPFYVWKDEEREIKYYATKWYRCKECGCLWEFEYPDFPAKGFVRKFENGIYTGTEAIENHKARHFFE